MRKIELELKSDKEIRSHMASVFQGVLMENVSRDLGNQLHLSQLHPYSQHSRKRSEGQRLGDRASGGEVGPGGCPRPPCWIHSPAPPRRPSPQARAPAPGEGMSTSRMIGDAATMSRSLLFSCSRPPSHPWGQSAPPPSSLDRKSVV